MGDKTSDAHWRSIVKAVSWRFFGSIDTMVLAFLVTGNIVWAGSIASVEVITKIILYYFHERVWGHYKWFSQGAGHRGSFIKGVSWRVIGTMDTFMLSWLITGHLGNAAKIASFETVTKICLFYVHERVWRLIPWGRDAHEARVQAVPETQGA